jgi:predicted DNA-binding transcriptional regulator YafY
VPRNSSKADKTTRCLTLLGALVRAKRGIQLTAFFKQKGWPERSAYRDIERLKEIGVPVEQPERGWYRVSEGWIPSTAVDVRRDELAALDSARRLVPGLRDLDALWMKLTGDSQLRLSLDPIIDARAPAIDYTRHQVAIAILQRGARDTRVVRLVYRDAIGIETTRSVEPSIVRWEPALEALYMVGWCRTRCAIRTFAVHRIVTVQLTDEVFDRRPDAATELANAFRVFARPTVEDVSLVFSVAVAREVSERRWHTSQSISALPDGSVKIEMQVATPHELERVLLGYGPDVVVQAPASLAERVRELHAASLAPERLGPRRAGARQRAALRADTL